MTSDKFDRVIADRIKNCLDTLGVKTDEYGTDDRLHNFKGAGEIQNCTPIKALVGMMCKHTVSVYG